MYAYMHDPGESCRPVDDTSHDGQREQLCVMFVCMWVYAVSQYGDVSVEWCRQAESESPIPSCLTLNSEFVVKTLGKIKGLPPIGEHGPIKEDVARSSV